LFSLLAGLAGTVEAGLAAGVVVIVALEFLSGSGVNWVVDL
jgi:hypothetical protein